MRKIATGLATLALAATGMVATPVASAQRPVPEGSSPCKGLTSSGGHPLLAIHNCTSRTGYAEVQFGYATTAGVKWTPSLNARACWLEVPAHSDRGFSAGYTMQVEASKPTDCVINGISAGDAFTPPVRGSGLTRFDYLPYSYIRVVRYH